MARASRHHRKVVQAKHIPDDVFLSVVRECSTRPWPYGGPAVTRPRWVHTSELSDAMPAMPTGVILAKANRLISRGLVTGCACGCRGDFELTNAGKAVLDGS